MHLELPHKMTQAKAIAHIKDKLDQHRKELVEHATINTEEWQDNTLHFAIDFQGKKISGTLLITDTDYVLDATLPLLWRMFEGKIEAEVKKQVEKMSQS